MRHQARVDEASGAFRGGCSCGWFGSWKAKLRKAANEAGYHAETARRCGKRRFASAAEADDVLLRAKIARGLRGDQRRREQRAYFCDECRAWHLTSQPLPARSVAS